MKENGKKIQAEDMVSVIKYMESLQKNLREAIEEVDYLRDQIQAMRDDTLRAKLLKYLYEMQDYLKKFGIEVEVRAAILWSTQSFRFTVKL